MREGKKRRRERERNSRTNHRFKRRRTAIGERIVSLFQRARLKALCASIETHCVYRTEETGTATRAITKKPLQHTRLLQLYIFHIYIYIYCLCL